MGFVRRFSLAFIELSREGMKGFLVVPYPSSPELGSDSAGLSIVNGLRVSFGIEFRNLVSGLRRCRIES